MDNNRITAIGQQLYRRRNGWSDRLAADLAVAPRTARSWIADPGTVGHRNIPAPMAELLVLAARHADQLRLWDRPAAPVMGLMFQRLDALMTGTAGELKECGIGPTSRAEGC